ncbi:hypothetical protein MVES1_001065 [Malassezia vespertilionis]|uniref:Uncharacterized protein n=1 Tax=Malassezia vespertilionis TaxID=2020962 RepID=A0A2N1JEW0_9BASI|nr:uncharacterized protein MVES1_001065 [Malassezia vespertilionis]PKI85065.1 hypothetical protein MVES_001005 [Malassezia vespertilionis]WFD05732.1 hypothetical protein MVES1_001065 [Malassezia vespertilionis]
MSGWIECAQDGFGRASQAESGSVAVEAAAPPGLESLQELLERKGYKETRIVSPVAQAVAMDDCLENVSDSCRESTVHGYQDMHAWMKNIVASQQQYPGVETIDTRVPRRTTSEAVLRKRSSAIWDASHAYRNGAPPVPPMPPVAPSLHARLAAPIVSKQDALVQHALPAKLPTLHRSKSQDLLHKALKKKNSARSLAPACSCGKQAPSASLWRRPTTNVEPRWHAQDCSVRVAWAMATPEPVPPPPPMLTLSTPRGSNPRRLDLDGKEYTPRSAHDEPVFLFGEQHSVAKRVPSGAHSPSRSLRRAVPRMHTSVSLSVDGASIQAVHGTRIPSSPGLLAQRTAEVDVVQPALSQVHACAEQENVRTHATALSKYEAARDAQTTPGKQDSCTLQDSPTLQRSKHRGSMRRAVPLRSAVSLAALTMQDTLHHDPQPSAKLDVRKPSKTRPVHADHRVLRRTDNVLGALPVVHAASRRVENVPLRRAVPTMPLGLGFGLEAQNSAPSAFLKGRSMLRHS